MSELPSDHDDLEQRLRSHYQRHFTHPPTPGQIWNIVADGLNTPTQGVRRMALSPESPAITAAPTSTKRRSNYITGVISVAVVVLLAIAAQVIFAGHHSSHTTPAGVATANPVKTPATTPGPQSVLTGISMTSPTDGWAVGKHGTIVAPNGVDANAALLYHYTGGAWHPVTIPFPPDHNNRLPTLDAVAMVNAHDGWAVGYADGDGLILHYDGTSWTRVSSPFHDELGGVQMVSADEGWSFSSNLVVSTNVTILHYTQGKWVVQYTRPGNPTASLNALSMVNAHEGWAVGTDFVAQRGTSSGTQPVGLLYHYQNDAWHEQSTFPNESMQAISLTSATDGWAGGQRYVGTALLPMLYHYYGGQWHEVPNAVAPPAGAHAKVGIDVIHMLSASDGWLGNGSVATDSGNAYLYHYNGATWNLVQVPIPNRTSGKVLSFSFLPDGEGWAAGTAGQPADTGAISTNLILHYINGQWSVQLS